MEDFAFITGSVSFVAAILGTIFGICALVWLYQCQKRLRNIDRYIYILAKQSAFDAFKQAKGWHVEDWECEGCAKKNDWFREECAYCDHPRE